MGISSDILFVFTLELILMSKWFYAGQHEDMNFIKFIFNNNDYNGMAYVGLCVTYF